MTNPFDDADGVFLVVSDHEGRHSLWPSFADVPAGWEPVYGPESREACLAYVRDEWTDPRPVPPGTPSAALPPFARPCPACATAALAKFEDPDSTVE